MTHHWFIRIDRHQELQGEVNGIEYETHWEVCQEGIVPQEYIGSFCVQF